MRRRFVTVNLMCMPLAGLALLAGFSAGSSLLYAAAAGVMGLAVFPLFILLIRRTPCPRCSVPLGNAALHAIDRRAPTKSCPHCGVGFDEPMKLGP
jgi:hypothetical protein